LLVQLKVEERARDLASGHPWLQAVCRGLVRVVASFAGPGQCKNARSVAGGPTSAKHPPSGQDDFAGARIDVTSAVSGPPSCSASDESRSPTVGANRRD
jgi:hypothetical protein